MWLSNDRFRNWMLIAYTLFWPVELWAALPHKAVEVKLREKPAATGELVRLVDVAEIYAKNLDQFEALAQLVLTQFPTDRQEVVIPGSYVRARVNEALGGKVQAEISVPDELRIVRGETLVSEERIAEEIGRIAREEKKMPEGVEIRVYAMQAPRELLLKTARKLTIEPAMQNPAWRGETTFKVQIGDDRIHWVKAQLRWFAERWVAKRDIRSLEALSAQDFEKRMVEVTSGGTDGIQAANVTELTQVLRDSHARRNLQANTILTALVMDKKPDLQSGSPVRVTFVAESGLRVTAEGAAVGNGSVGGLVKARLVKSKKIVSGRLVSGNMIEVSL